MTFETSKHYEGIGTREERVDFIARLSTVGVNLFTDTNEKISKHRIDIFKMLLQHLETDELMAEAKDALDLAKTKYGEAKPCDIIAEIQSALDSKDQA